MHNLAPFFIFVGVVIGLGAVEHEDTSMMLALGIVSVVVTAIGVFFIGKGDY